MKPHVQHCLHSLPIHVPIYVYSIRMVLLLKLGFMLFEDFLQQTDATPFLTSLRFSCAWKVSQNLMIDSK